MTKERTMGKLMPRNTKYTELSSGDRGPELRVYVHSEDPIRKEAKKPSKPRFGSTPVTSQPSENKPK
jgi:hypothetical protein